MDCALLCRSCGPLRNYYTYLLEVQIANINRRGKYMHIVGLFYKKRYLSVISWGWLMVLLPTLEKKITFEFEAFILSFFELI